MTQTGRRYLGLASIPGLTAPGLVMRTALKAGKGTK